VRDESRFRTPSSDCALSGLIICISGAHINISIQAFNPKNRLNPAASIKIYQFFWASFIAQYQKRNHTSSEESCAMITKIKIALLSLLLTFVSVNPYVTTDTWANFPLIAAGGVKYPPKLPGWPYS
jgi:hypothetical protein